VERRSMGSSTQCLAPWYQSSRGCGDAFEVLNGSLAAIAPSIATGFGSFQQ
jgi:hypothetical protein